MISGHKALRRQLQAFLEGSGIPWNNIYSVYGVEDGRVVYDDQRDEIRFTHNGKHIELVIYAPGVDPAAAEILPLGKLAARIDGGEIIKGPIDQAVWNKIAEAINHV